MTHTQNKHIRFSTLLFGALCICFFVIFSALGIWQIQRLNWKKSLISSVNQRIHLPPIKAPPQSQWPQLTFEKDEYRPVVIAGKFLTDKNIFITAVTQNTTGYWVLTPLQTDDNALVFVNRGFIPMDAQRSFQHQDQPHTDNSSYKNSITNTEQTIVIGLLRMSEKNGFFPRKNDPDNNLWYTRDLPAMAKKLRLSTVAPYFIDAGKETAPQKAFPITGLTVIHWPNNHLTYAITWFTLAIGALSALFFVLRQKS
ncbi:SURF1 family protein [Bartonella sp. B41]